MWTDEFSAYGTVGATIAAVLFGAFSVGFTIHERRLRRRQDAALAEQSQKDQRAAIRSQAERIAAWRQLAPPKDPPAADAGRVFLARRRRGWQIVVQNASDQPIWDVFLDHWSLEGTEYKPLPVIAPGERRVVACLSKPKSTETAEDEAEEKTQGHDGEEAITISFRDNAGRQWRRPGRVPGMLKLEHDATFADLETAEAPVIYKAPGLKLWIEDRWPVRKTARSKAKGPRPRH